eukprot:CAMPEP_0117046424 /NCGR_PEP_ID=MMETSP0472-20121206/32104_1 /TAXON_ID=693140 ORGANISM="Tiarina fusus, Strain LIS" /NCGR_SAMPLE_ID=MMETSP0472 /ASSEMBLY_ACC=CAM_ASM_000603 /LENGTH=117 /DNA_ID=CAMNT_0004758779 /DNA_START=33 /DNA_END=386 /DNA_ORIENTATION=+
MFQQTTPVSSPATEALQKALCLSPTPVINKEKPMITVQSLKRSRSGFSFDMSAFDEASQQVEDSIAFPSIEWSFDDSDDEDDEDIACPAAKRRCSGLSRCPSFSDLSAIPERRGSLC